MRRCKLGSLHRLKCPGLTKPLTNLVADGAALNVIETQVFVVPTRPMLASDLPAISGGQLSRGVGLR